jgi:hypothetical protein
MLLNDIGKSPNTRFNRINQYLETNYGFKIYEDVSDKDLVSIMEQIEGEIIELKVKGEDSKTSPEISKRLLVLEGMKTLREFAILQLQSPDLDKVVNGLSDYVADCFRLSGTTHQDFEECLRDGMKHYRSSKYRFPDELIEQKVRQEAMSRIHSPISSEEPVITDSFHINEFKESPIMTRDEYLAKRKELQRIQMDPETARDPMMKKELMRKTAELNKQAAAAGLVEKKEVDGDESIEEAKSNIMKEHANLVKNLRRLLETEVSQAEVMMAAKGFAQELQEMVEKIGRLQNEDLPPVVDQMRETYGSESSSAFQTQIYGALQGVMDALYTAKSQVDDAVSNLAETGHIGAEIDMDKGLDGDLGVVGDDMPMDEPELDLDNIDDELGGEDEFGGAETEEPLGRAMKSESVERLQRKVTEMKNLVERARKIKESKKA